MRLEPASVRNAGDKVCACCSCARTGGQREGEIRIDAGNTARRAAEDVFHVPTVRVMYADCHGVPLYVSFARVPTTPRPFSSSLPAAFAPLFYHILLLLLLAFAPRDPFLRKAHRDGTIISLEPLLARRAAEEPSVR